MSGKNPANRRPKTRPTRPSDLAHPLIRRLAGVLLAAVGLFATATSGAPYDTATEQFTIARVKYEGGGDWYSNPSSLPNLLKFIREQTGIPTQEKETVVELTSPRLFNYPYLYMNGHGNIHFSDREIQMLRRYFAAGGFLHADDNYGMDESFRREMKRVFPHSDLVELPFSHPVYHSWFDLPNGCPKIHYHDGKPAQGFGIFMDGRMVVYYSYQSDLGDGWEDPEVHQDPPEKRLAALRMGTNLVVWRLKGGE